MKKSRKKSYIEKIFDWVIIIIGILFLTYLYLWSFCNMLNKFGVMSIIVSFWFQLIGTIIIFFVIVGYMIFNLKSKRKTKLSNWVSQNRAKIWLYLAMSSICFVSIKSEKILELSELKNFISLEWTIFSISIAIFLVWNVMILKYLKDRLPKNVEEGNLFQKYEYIERKGIFYKDASILFSTISLLTANLVILILSTASLFVLSNEQFIIKQNAVILSFYFCTNTIIELFMGIIKPLNEEREKILNSMRVTNEEIDFQNELDDKVAETLSVMRKIDKLTSITEEEKDKIKFELLAEFAGSKKEK